MKVRGDAAFFDLFKLADDVKVRLQFLASIGNRAAKYKLIQHPLNAPLEGGNAHLGLPHATRMWS
jgi:hypothetical protein